MKLKRLLSAIIGAILLISSIAIVPVSAEDLSFDYSSLYCDITGGYKSAKIEKNVSFNGKNALKVIPDPNTTHEKTVTNAPAIKLDSYYKIQGVDLTKIRSVKVEYYIDAPEAPARRMVFSIVDNPTDVLLKEGSLEAVATEELVTGQWATASFDLSALKERANPDNTKGLQHFQISPYGMTKYKEISENAVFYIGNVIFSTDTVASGTSEPVEVEETEDIVSSDYSAVHCGFVNNRKYATIELNVSFEGKNAAKVIPDPDTTDANTAATTNSIKLDSYFKLKGVDLTKVRYASVDYYIDADTIPQERMQLFIVDNPKGTLPDGNGSLTAEAMEPMVIGKWATATFDLTDLATRATTQQPMLQHFQIAPYGSTSYKKISADDVCYISSITFFKDKPNFDKREAYMQGYTDGTFLPGNTMTRAEACTTVARIAAGNDALVPTDKTSAFTDVASHWGNKYIAYVESLGYLNSYSGAFLPDQPITRAEFVELVYNMGLLQDAGKPAAFTDVDASHPRYNVIIASAKAGLVNGYDNGDGTFSFKPDNTITRAEVVTVINRARGRDTLADAVLGDINVIFVDVDRSHWAFGNIAEATIAHNVADGKWISVDTDPVAALIAKLGEDAVYGFTASNAFLAELDALEDTRIAEIRATASDYSKITGKKIYVSSSTGSDANDGLTENTPVKSILKANQLAAYGDGILLKRGDMWRESVYAVSGVTYTAYGEGAKPFINASPENGADPAKWTLVHEDKSTGALVWKYANENFLDTGVIVLNDGKDGAFAEKVACDYSFANKYFYLRGKKDTPYSYKTLGNMQFFHAIDASALSQYNNDTSEATGPIYLRCDYGNPGSVFESIEFATRTNCVKVQTSVTDVVFDNLCLKYSGFYGISLDTGVKNVTVQNCEIGWIGGTITNFGRYQEDQYTRLGNGIEIYGAVDGFYIDNNYVYQCYDAGITPQVSAELKDCRQDNMRIKNNVVTDCVYSIEYFLGDDTNGMYDRAGNNFLIEGNLLRRAGWGFGSSRPDIDNQRHIRSGTGRDAYYNFVIKNNIFDRAVQELVDTGTREAECEPVYSGNTFIQGLNNGLYITGTEASNQRSVANLSAKYNIAKDLGDTTAQVYFVPNIPKWTRTIPVANAVPVTDAERAAYEAYIANNPDTPAAPTTPVTPAEPEKPAEPEVPSTPAEDEEIIEPELVSFAGDKTFYKYAYNNKTTNGKDAATGIAYVRVEPTEEGGNYRFDIYELPKFDVSGGKFYFKVLLRTNDKKALPVTIGVYQVIDAEGTPISAAGAPIPGGVGDLPLMTAETATVADGTWQEIILGCDTVAEAAKLASQINLSFAGRGVKGASYFESGAQSDVYYDLAAWAVFKNYSSAKAYDLKAAAAK